MLAVALAMDSNTVDRSSSAEEIGPVVFAICKMVSGNFQRKERISKTSFSLLKQINLQRKTCAELSKVGVSSSTAPSFLCRCLEKESTLAATERSNARVWEGKKIRNKANSE